MKFFLPILFLMGLFSCQANTSMSSLSALKCTQNAQIHNALHFQAMNNDTIQVGLDAQFFRFAYEGEGYAEEDAIRFILSVKNSSTHAIPDIQSSRWDHVKIFINGESDFEMTIVNCINGNMTIAPGATDVWNFDLQISGPYAINYGNVFTFQWQYCNQVSKIIEVNLTLRTFTEVKMHRK